MDHERLRDVFNRGMGNAARVIGQEYDVFRPHGSDYPLAAANRIMRLPVILEDRSSGSRRPRGFERVVRATFDGIAVRHGDYIRGPLGILFVAAMPMLEPAVCVKTDRIVDILRPAGPTSAGLSSYGGVVEESLERVLTGWPAQFDGGGTSGAGILPADGGRSSWSVLMSQLPVPIKPSDLLQDDAGRRFVVRACEQSDMGWHLQAAGTEV